MAMLLSDTLYALRRLWHSKAFATVAILCLGFGIGLNATIFSVMDGVLLKPYPFTKPDELRVIRERNQKGGVDSGLSYLDMRDWKAANTSFTTIAASSGRSLTIADAGQDPQRYLGAAISWDLFPLLGKNPVVGHGFTEADDQQGAPPVAILGYELWMNRYHGDKSVIGRSVLINAKPTVIVGVMEPKFQFPQNQELWIPLTPIAFQEARNNRSLFAFGRLKPGVSLQRAQQDLDAIAARLAVENPTTNTGWTSAQFQELRERFLPEEVPIVIMLMMGGVTLVLFIACSNVANLLLARASARRREISVRTALGAGRGRIIRQLLTESVVLSLVSVPLGIGLAAIGTKLIAGAMPAGQVPYYVTWDLDWRSIAYTVAIAVTTALLFGLFPALQVSRGNLHESLKEGTRGNSASRSLLRSTLVVVQVSLALVALFGALLFVRTFGNLGGSDVGFDTKPLMSMRFYMAGPAYAADDAILRRVQDVVTRVEALPGVEAAFASNLVPLAGGGGTATVVVDGRPPMPAQDSGIFLMSVTPHFYRTMGVPVTEGRDVTDAEGWTRSAVAVVNQTMAKKFWPARSAIGGRFKSDAPNADWFTVVGVSRDLNLFGVDPENRGAQPVAFVSYAYQQTINTGLTIRVAGPPAAITGDVRDELRRSDPNLPVSQVRTVEEGRQLSFWQYGLYGWIFGAIGLMALILASIGVYGVLSYSVEQRTQEIGVRLALGAGRGSVLRLVVGHGLTLAGIGVVLGLVAAPFAMREARNLLFHVSPFDPISLASVALFLMTVAFLASYLPALRATRVDPIVALRGE